MFAPGFTVDSMSKRFRTYSLDQPFLVRQRDLNEIYDHYERKDGRGLAAYHPEMLTRLCHLRYLQCGESLLQSQQGQRAEGNSNLLDSAAEQLLEFALVGIGKMQARGAA